MISIQKNKIKGLILVALLVIMFILIVLILKKNNYIEVFSNSIQGEKTEKNMIDGISINNVNLIYDVNNNTYYLPIKLEENEEQIELHIKIQSLENIKSKIGNTEFSKEIKLKENINYDTVLELSMESILYKNNCRIKFTNIPIINMSFNENKIGTEYIYSQISITDPEYVENNTQYQYNLSPKVRYRGSSTMHFDKKGYRLKMEEDIDFGLLGMSNSKTWVLDALSTDSTCLRTKISSDLWGNINEDLDKYKYTELNSKYVEVFINDRYIGLYLLKEVIDEELLNLDTKTGVLIKGINWESVDFNNYNNVETEIYGPFEIKYPKSKNKYPESWTNILNKLKNYYNESTKIDAINETFYKENLANFRIFVLILQAIDNLEFKNMYYSIKDNGDNTKVLITPWDLDLTFGLMLWDEQNSKFITQYDRVEEVTELFGIREDTEFINYIKQRWQYLSQSQLSKEKVVNMINEQYNYLTKAGALERENSKYHNIDTANEIQKLKEWYNKRFEVINKYIKSL